MEREEFLKSLGLGLALVCTGSCFSACSKDDDTNEPPAGNSGNKVTVNLSSSLIAVGSQAVVSGVLFYRIAEGNAASSFVATERICPHQGGNLNWVQSEGKVVCDSHAGMFTTAGAIAAQPSSGGTMPRAIKIYPVTIDGNTLTATKV